MSDTPAHHTKHFPILAYLFNDIPFHLIQRDDGISNGTALWLGAQVLSIYLATQFNDKSRNTITTDTVRPKAVELGSGIGLMALVLASLGYDVLATDTTHVCASVLRNNVSANAHLVPGCVHVRELDWDVDPKGWTWHDPCSITSPAPLTRDDDRRNVLSPPFDLIVSSDTIYDAALVTPLFKTIHALSALSYPSTPSPPSSLSSSITSYPSPSTSRNSSKAQTCKPPLIYLAVERRDPTLITTAFTRAREEWGLFFQRVPNKKLKRAGVGVGWDDKEWEGVEVWHGRWDGVTGALK